MQASGSEKFSDPGMNADIEYFQELADGAPVMIWMSGQDMGCFYFNRAWLDYRGRTLQEEFGNGWAEGVHPEDMDRCVQHYISSFERRAPFAMSYRLKHRSGEYRWILDRGAPHYAADGAFLGFFGGCAETPAEIAVERINQLRAALHEMQDFAVWVAMKEISAALLYPSGVDSPILKKQARQLNSRQAALKNAASQFGKLASDMLVYDRIENGACWR